MNTLLIISLTVKAKLDMLSGYWSSFMERIIKHYMHILFHKPHAYSVWLYCSGGSQSKHRYIRHVTMTACSSCIWPQVICVVRIKDHFSSVCYFGRKCQTFLLILSPTVLSKMSDKGFQTWLLLSVILQGNGSSTRTNGWCMM